MGDICKLEKKSLPLDLVYQDSSGAKIGLAISNNDSDLDEISNVSRSLVDKLVILTNRKISSPNNATIVNVDKSKMVDLIYFNNKYTRKKIEEADNEKAKNLAKTLCII